MPRRNNRREAIIEAAADLFLAQGYAATPVRQIAEAVGVTEAALYYHFKLGKRALFEAVIERNLPDFFSILDDCHTAVSLPELLLTFGSSTAENRHQRTQQLRWILSEYPQLTADEKEMVQTHYLRFHAQLSALIQPFTTSDEQAADLAWMMMCLSAGYGQLFVNLELEQKVPYRLGRFITAVADLNI